MSEEQFVSKRVIGYDIDGRICFAQESPFGFGGVPEGLTAMELDAEMFGQISAHVGGETFYVVGATVQNAPARPSVCHDWNWATKTWLPNLAAAKYARKSAVDQESAQRTFAPIAYDNALFDADAGKSRPRITGLYSRLLRGDGLPLGWVGWRDAANTYHWVLDSVAAIQAHLAALMSAIENREQALLVSAWTHKANIDGLTSVEEVLAYDINSGWPQ